MGLFKRNKKETPKQELEVKVETTIPKVQSEVKSEEKKEDKKTSTNSQEKPKPLVDEKLETQISKHKNFKSENTILKENLEGIDSQKDITKKDLTNLSSKVYKYWVWVFKNDKRISSFGVNEEEYAGVKLLVRREDVNGTTKVIFRELYPEPRFDLNNIKNNKSVIKEELNKLKQIETKLEKNQFKAKPESYNFDISDVRIEILQREIELNSIRYGVTTKYIHDDFRDDKVPVIIYDMENSGLKLRKYVKEKNLYTEASENKKIESKGAKDQIDHHLKKLNDRDWLKVAILFGYILVLGILSYAAWEWMNYNQEQAFTNMNDKLDKMLDKQFSSMDLVVEEIKKAHLKDYSFQESIIQTNTNILNQCKIPDGGIPIASK